MIAASSQPTHRLCVLVRGVVQGVGFRPFVYRLAAEMSLAGFISNDTDGVTIEIEGLQSNIDGFVMRLRSEAPALSRIDSIQSHELASTGETGFRIVVSHVLGAVTTAIPADAATCPDCLRELLDPANRRYRYPFLNCTNCGPRFTITRLIPYDRPQTSMAAFPMCAICQAEFDDPHNRRFHAQPNACWTCGPGLQFTDAHGRAVAVEDPVTAATGRLMEGQIVAIKGIGGFHLAVDACNEGAVRRLRRRKHRYGKPLAVMVRDLDAAHLLCRLTPVEEEQLTSVARPIVLCLARPGSRIAPSVAPGIPWLGLFLPYAPLHRLLFADPRVRALVMTSANLSEEPIAIDNAEALSRLGDIADAFLVHNREILQRCDDSVVAEVDGVPQIVRRARGFAPLSTPLPIEAPPLLAVGGHLKSVFALARGRHAYQSQHLGDLENLTGLQFFNESLDHLMRTFGIDPKFVAHDLHPGYLSTTWAFEWAGAHGLPLIGVQHHHAHIAACMAEHAITEPVIGLSLDGTGYGTDAHIWGGEVLLCSLDSFRRFAHLDYVPMPGGDAAVREPWRMALTHLSAAGIDPTAPEMLRLLDASSQDARLLLRMIDRGINSPMTSSLGRLFDAVAALLLRRHKVDYEAQAAIELEGLAVGEPDDVPAYEMALSTYDGASHELLRISPRPMWDELLYDLRTDVPASRIAARFHAAVARVFVQAATGARAAENINTVALSGGVMHNRRLARLLRSQLESDGFSVIQHRHVSPGDGGLSYGQAAVAAARLAGS